MYMKKTLCAIIVMVSFVVSVPLTAFSVAPVISASSSNVTNTSFTMNSYIDKNNGVDIQTTFFYITDSSGYTQSIGWKTPTDDGDRSNSYTFYNVSPGTYKFQAVSVNADNESGYSQWVTVTIDEPPQTISDNISVSELSDRMITQGENLSLTSGNVTSQSSNLGAVLVFFHPCEVRQPASAENR